MTYFIDPYKKYYSKLGGADNLSTTISSISGNMGGLSTDINRIASNLSGSNWNEQGVNQLNSNVFPLLENAISTFSNNISNKMQQIANSAANLYKAAEKLKNEDEKYDSLQEELKNLVVCLSCDENGDPNPEYNIYLNKKNRLENDIRNSKNYCEGYVRECDSIVNSIKGLDSSLDNINVSFGGISKTKGTGISILESVNNGKLLKISYNGREFYIVNSRINAIDYQKYIEQYGLCQNNGLLPADCMLLSQYYVMDMLRGTYTSGEAMRNCQGSPATRIDGYVKSTYLEDVLNYIYGEALDGRPTVLQVSQVNSDKGDRHLVAFVGFDTSVKSIDDLTPDNIFVLDCVDGKLQTLAQARSEGGHERYIFAQGGNYFARGATEEFKAQEVYNEEWQRKHSNAA